MKRDFKKELETFCRSLDLPAKVRADPQKLYNIHKRSLPPTVDKIVTFGVTESDAKKLIGTVFKVRQQGETVEYYEAIVTNATVDEKSPFYNPPHTREALKGDNSAS